MKKSKKVRATKSPIDGLINKWASETINDYIRPVLPEIIAVVDVAYDQGHCTPEIKLTLNHDGKPKMAEMALRFNFSLIPKNSKIVQTRKGMHFVKNIDFSLPFPCLVGPLSQKHELPKLKKKKA